MRKLLIFGLLICCSIGTVVSAQGPWDYPDAQDGMPSQEERCHQRYVEDDCPPPEYEDYHQKARARNVISETADYLEKAQRAALHGYGDGLGRAFAHQEEARDRYSEGCYEIAIRHSLHARDIAISIIEENRMGRGYHHRRHRHADPLDNELHVRIIDDSAALRLEFHF